MQTRWLTRFFLAVAAIILLSLQYTLWCGRGGLVSVMQYRALNQEQANINTGYLQRNQHLIQHIAALRDDPQAVEALARSELGMIKPGEVLYRVVE